MPSVGGKKNFQSFTVICRKPHAASSICLRTTIFQNPEGTLWTHCIMVEMHRRFRGSSETSEHFYRLHGVTRQKIALLIITTVRTA
jgi:hypothetical protein